MMAGPERPTVITHTLSQVPYSAICSLRAQAESAIVILSPGVGRLLLHYLECTEKIYTSNYQGADPIGVKIVGSESNPQPKFSLMNKQQRGVRYLLDTAQAMSYFSEGQRSRELQGLGPSMRQSAIR